MASYIAECSEGENKGETHFLKLIPREIAETERFEEIFFRVSGNTAVERRRNLAHYRFWANEVEKLDCI